MTTEYKTYNIPIDLERRFDKIKTRAMYTGFPDYLRVAAREKLERDE